MGRRPGWRGDQSRHRGSVARRRRRPDAGGAVAAAQSIRNHQHDAGDQNYANPHQQPEQPGLPNPGEIKRGAKCKCEEWDQRRRDPAQKIAHLAVQVADPNARCQRQDAAH